MERNSNLTGVLNDLIRINNDRTTGYAKAADNAREIDVDLRAIFDKMGDESREYARELANVVATLGGEPASGTTASGKIYRAWMDVKATFTGKDRTSLLAACEFGEDAAQRAYQSALASDAEMPAEIRQLIATQKSALRTSHDLIKKYRDMNAVLK
jgi:uncharacterized protein (TIGR02284 family)